MDTTVNEPHRLLTAAPGQGPAEPTTPPLPVWRLNLMRVGYTVMAAGLAITKWPQLTDHGTWELKEGTVVCMLVALSVLALLGLRHPVRMLPILLLETAWKLLWLGIVAVPLWADGELSGATQEQASAVLWVVIVVAVIPWRYVFTQFVTGRGKPWHTREA